MKRTLVWAAAVGALALPVGAVAKPTQTDRTNAANECRTERGTTAATREAFALKYGTNKNRRNAFGKCVSRNARDEESERTNAQQNAAKPCQAERDQLGEQAFDQKYGTNPNKKNAFGKCVSGKAQENKALADKQDRQEAEKRQNAAKRCAAERKQLGEQAFADKYGTSRGKRNAFGKCVSKLARS